jgi:NADH:ubiquinone oxidoreductase subunit 5 (subunit L)/multisubunit Na+/H+ antiporter MnhA subunit/multisubunit Na+/H+ antiporter MnhB subunit
MAILLFLAILLPTLFGTALLLPIRGVGRFAGLLSSLITFASFTCIFLIYLNIDFSQAVLFTIPWVPSLKVNLSFLIDGLSLFFGFLVTGVGTLVNLYAHYYMDKSDSYLRRFYIYLNLFTSAMLGCVFADNLLVMFLFWELTGVTSFLLIGYSFTDKSSLISARMVFLVTSLTSLSLLVGILIIGTLNDTFLWTKIVTQGVAYGNHSYWQVAVILCFMTAIFGKSAQIPFHFWLPNAMCAPTPISAYLHSATMVKLGVFLTARMYPLFVTSEIWFPLVVSVCLLTMLIGAVFSLLSNDLKMILAYATVSQLGFFISIYGMGDISGVGYDFVHILNHAFYKGSLFMLVGIINHATGIRDIRQLGGLWKKLPATSVIFFIATLAMAGVPGTTGFISKELILKDLLLIETNIAGGIAILALIVSASVFKVAFSIRLFYHLFIRKNPTDNIIVHRPIWKVLVAPGVLSMCALGFGIWPAGLDHIVENFYVSGLHLEELPSLKVWHGWSLELMISATILGMGVFLFYVAEKRQVWSQLYPFPDFANLWNRLMESSVFIAQKVTLLIKGSSVHRHIAVLLLFFACGIGGVLALEGAVPWKVLTQFPGSIYRWVALVMIVCTTLAVPLLSGSLSQVLALASSGFSVTLYFVFYKAPDLAMTQILIEVVTGIMLLVMVWVFRKEVRVKDGIMRTILRFTTAFFVAMAGVAISLSYSGLENPKSLSEYFLVSSIPLTKGANAVNAILVDFRGLDTLGEVTVLLIAAIAIIGLVTRKQPPEISWNSKLLLVPSDILRTLTPAIFFIINLFALYLLIRGHNQPGGGFVAGLASGIAFILVGFSLQLCALKKLLPINLLMLSVSGVTLTLIVGLLPLLLGMPFLTHGALQFPTALIFDVGVYIIVLGITLINIFALRSDALREEKYYEQ